MAYIRRIVAFTVSHLKTTRGKVIAAGIVVLLVIIEVVSNGANLQTATAERGTIVDTVRVVGSVQPAESVDLAFAAAGRVVSTPVQVGETVTAGQLLASLDTGELSAQYRDAQANVLAQQARLDELERGTRLDEIAIKESEFNAAVQDLDDAYDDIRSVLVSAYTYANSGVRVQLDELFTQIGSSDDPRFDLNFSCPGSCLTSVLLAESLRRDVDGGLSVWADRMQNLGALPNEAKLDALQGAQDALEEALTLLDTIDMVLNSTSVGLSTDDINDYRADVSTGRTSVSTALTSVTGQVQAVTSAQLTVDRIANELALKKAGSTPEQITAQEAIVLSAQAQVDRIGALIRKHIIRSPIAGIVTVQDAKVGQTVAIGEAVVAVISGQELEVEANVPEVDIGPIAVGNPVQIEVDALPGKHFSGTLVSIEPAETIVDGVVNFQVTVAFDVSDERLKSGLTVNLDIETARIDDALGIPVYALVTEGGETFVDVIRDGDVERVRIRTGVRSTDGMVQVTSGLTEGDRVVLQ